MGKVKQDYKIWKQAKAETKRCENVMEEYKYKITDAMSDKEWQEYSNKVMEIHTLMKDKRITVTDADFSEKYADDMKQLQAKGCFFRVYRPIYIPHLDCTDFTFIGDDSYRCANNHTNGQIYEKHCEGCPKFNELVEYQMLETNVKLAREKQRAAWQVLLNNFRKVKTK